MKKAYLAGLIAALLLLTSCAAPSSPPAAPVNPVSSEAAVPQSTAPATRIFVDSAGREVELPAEIKGVAPSGPLAQVVLYTACPDKLAGLAGAFSDDAKKYINEKYWSLPIFGQFYGKNVNLNMEALIAAAPDVIVDIGEAKKTVKEDMDALQKQLGIPTVFIEASLETMDSAYIKLGELTGETQRAAQLADYCKQTLEQAKKNSGTLSDKERVTVYMAMGDAGLNTNARGSFHAQVIDTVGAVNVADIEVVSSGGGSEVSFEKLLTWNPDIIIVDTEKLYERITADPMWQELDAVKNGRIYRNPDAPYNFMSNPPSVNRIIGIKWFGELAYPPLYGDNPNKDVKAFYKLFYSIDLTDTQMAEIMKNAAPAK